MADPTAPTPPSGIPEVPFYRQSWFLRLIGKTLGGVCLAVAMMVPNPIIKVVLQAVGQGIVQVGDVVPPGGLGPARPVGPAPYGQFDTLPPCEPSGSTRHAVYSTPDGGVYRCADDGGWETLGGPL